MMTHRFLALGVTLFWMAGILVSDSVAEEPAVVVELFTSQGCSACPPADALLAQMSRDPSVVSISWHVDYWNELGWKDTLSRPEFTERQRAYQDRMDVRFVYTPQVVVNGRYETVGSKEHKVATVLEKGRRTGLGIPLSYEARNGGVAVNIGKGDTQAPATVWLVNTISSREVKIGGGENSGRKLTYTNVASGMRKLGTYTGQPQTLMIPGSHIAQGESDGCALLLQEEGTGPIIGALSIDKSAIK